MEKKLLLWFWAIEPSVASKLEYLLHFVYRVDTFSVHGVSGFKGKCKCKNYSEYNEL